MNSKVQAQQWACTNFLILCLHQNRGTSLYWTWIHTNFQYSYKTGIRQDAFANENRIPNVVEKEPKEKGLYLHPSAFGFSQDKSIHRTELR